MVSLLPEAWAHFWLDETLNHCKHFSYSILNEYQNGTQVKI